jgi:hypothetical protein
MPRWAAVILEKLPILIPVIQSFAVTVHVQAAGCDEAIIYFRGRTL